jgi:uncharacterized protein YwqG
MIGAKGFDSDYDGTGYLGGDAGKIYFWIRKDDLLNQRFDRVNVMAQCD